MHPRSRAVRRAVSGLGQCACARTVLLLVRTASCDVRHGNVQSWGREDAAAAVAAARAGSQAGYRGGGSGAGSPGPLPSPLPLPPPPLSCGSRGVRDLRRGGDKLWVRVSGVLAPFPGRRERTRGRGGGEGSEAESVPGADQGARARPAFNLASLPDPPRGTVCRAVAPGADREGPGSALLSTAVCSAWRPLPVSPLPARGPESSLTSSRAVVFPYCRLESLPSFSSFPSLLLVLGISLVAGFEWVLLGTFIVPGVRRFSLPFL